MVLGIKKSMLSFFKMDRGIDTGKIIFQMPYKINADDDIKTLSDRIEKLAFTSALSIGEKLNSDDFISEGKEQNHIVSNTWRKRTLYDVTIDFRMTGDNILSLIRSFTFPFSGALIINKDSVYHVTTGAKTDKNDVPENSLFVESGKILHVESNLIRVKSADCILDLKTKEKLDISMKSQKYIHPPLKYLIENPSLKQFFQ
jgi:methionyl-tRNA formyltransferase